ncbi:MAG: putative toxin-antitoxin system toxin component, PIN family [Deltaproteobacteria bacterium]|jgi:putative PIN family toxin of toxin-antitoxin system|nr:putative toxin-antitoxin system toxin component, PIN family [Deltaproteobacteria bacterium]
MKIVLDTNVLVSGIFFSGPPAAILQAWSRGKIRLVVSPEILEEYARVSAELSGKFSGIEIQSILDLIVVHSEVCSPPPLSQPVCEDLHDDMFFAAAIDTKTKIIISGDKHLLKASGYHGISVLTPRQFIMRYLPE